MTTSLFRSFSGPLILLFMASQAFAVEDVASIQILSAGRSFHSFEAYDRSRGPVESADRPVQSEGDPASVAEKRLSDVAGVTPSLAQVVSEFQGSDLAERMDMPLDGLAAALEEVAQGRERPLLLVADEQSVQIMELKPETMTGTNP